MSDIGIASRMTCRTDDRTSFEKGLRGNMENSPAPIYIGYYLDRNTLFSFDFRTDLYFPTMIY